MSKELTTNQKIRRKGIQVECIYNSKHKNTYVTNVDTKDNYIEIECEECNKWYSLKLGNQVASGDLKD